MIRYILVTIYLVSFAYITYAQDDYFNVSVKVLKICELKEVFLIECFNEEKNDTLFVASPKEDEINREVYKRIEIGSTYQLQLQKQGIPSTEEIVIRIKNTILWRSGDNIKSMPYFSKQLKGRFIEKSR